MSKHFSKYWLPDLSQRDTQSELMDDPNSNIRLLYRTLAQFEHINSLFSGYKKLTRQFIIPDMLARRKKVYRVIDIGCGGGDYARWLTKECNGNGVTVQITCIDSDKRIADYASDNCQNYSNIQIVHRDATDPEVWKNPFDYSYANHFLHHLPNNEILPVVQLINRHTLYGFLLNDILRSQIALIAYTILGLFFFRNSFALYDGRISIKKGFKVTELKRLIYGSSNIQMIKVEKCWPFRCLVYQFDNHS